MNKLMKIVSFNVNGLNGHIKRKRVLAYLKKIETDIAFIQEHNKLKRGWIGQVFASSFNSKARGVAILITKNIPLTVQDTISDPLGRYILINCQIYSEQWTFLNL